MADNLWRHALDTLDHYKDPEGGADISHLYEYEENDTTGILKRHKTLVHNVTSEPKTMYFEFFIICPKVSICLSGTFSLQLSLKRYTHPYYS